ncbi:MAG: three-Cys-motif partner protein TcmP [Planctomycetota bacterium]
MSENELDQVGPWTEIKLKIIEEYAKAYATIMNKQKGVIRHTAYIDGFAGPGTHVSRTTGEEIEGSPAIALKMKPGFSHYHFIDLDGKRAQSLRQLAGDRPDVTVYEEDCNTTLIEKVFPQCQWEHRRRALCLLDPYNLNPNWEVVETAGNMRSIEIFLNFMIMDANMNVFPRDPHKVPEAQIERMNRFWGDESWRNVVWRTSSQLGLFGDIKDKAPNEAIIAAYRKRLKDVAGFTFVPEPIPMQTRTGAAIYYLFFASHSATGDKIARDIFNKYRNKDLPHGE